MARFTILLALAVALLAGGHGGYASGTNAPVIHCTAYEDAGGLVQLDCVGGPWTEAYERLVPVADVYTALAPAVAGSSFDLVWESR